MSHNQINDGNDPTAAPAARWMRQLANDPLERSHRPLPDPDLLWMKAQLLDRQSAVERSLSVVRWFDVVSRILAGFAAAWMAIGIAKVFHIPSIGSLNPGFHLTHLTLTSLAIALVLVAAAVVAFPIWSED